MLNLNSTISTIEELLKKDTEASVVYSALECRLAIEKICYERLRIAHDYISHDDLKKWQPRDIVRTLIQEVDSNIAETFTLSISKHPIPNQITEKEFKELEYLPIGTQVGFNPQKMGALWNAMANLALHIKLPMSTTDSLAPYGDKDAIKEKVLEALTEIKRISKGTLLSSGMGEEISFPCTCGSKNKRRLDLLTDGQIINCINLDCNESYIFSEKDHLFTLRSLEVICKVCGTKKGVPIKTIEKLRTNQNIYFQCEGEGCEETIHVAWRPMQRQSRKNFQA